MSAVPRWTDAEPLARLLVRQAAGDAKPRSPQVHLLARSGIPQLWVVNGSRLYDLPPELTDRFAAVLDAGDETALAGLLGTVGLTAAPAIDDTPLAHPPLHALSLAVAQACNLGCSYCYAQQGSFGGPAKQMPLTVARQAVDQLLAEAAPGTKVNLAFLGGEPLANRAVLRATTDYAATKAAARGVSINFSITTNGTLLEPSDAEFFEAHGFAVTVSLDGSREVHDRLRPFKNGSGSFDRILARTRPLLERQRRMQVSVRITVTPANLDLPATLDEFITLGFHSVGFSPLLRSVNGAAEMRPTDLETMLEAMIACGLATERAILGGRRYPFLNLVNALRELHRGTHRPYPCGAGAGYFGVSAEGELAACHRFVDDEQGRMGHLAAGPDPARQTAWLAERHVHRQEPCQSCWARYLCGGGCHHEVLARGRTACDFIRGWLHYTMQAYGRLSRLCPNWFDAAPEHRAGL
ncbi:radical SAM family protein [Methylocaldum marinum]|uniref:Radical SAM family protein n=1 Tax=Methylocaldum marinum TaxID=1432792 RepID=A0A250KPN0_9GAMM|nr:radical SAM protein [Methylocaldum marinum]BBA33482.1 radical SAM family protein [Methylocaldum marinum]